MKSKTVPALLVLVVLLAAAAWYWWPRLAPAPVPPPTVSAPPTSEAPPAIAHPIATDQADSAEPAGARIEDHDPALLKALLALPGGLRLADLLVPENLIRHIVATVDALPRHKLAVALRPVHGPSGNLRIEGDDQHGALDERNAARYAPAMAALQGLDMPALAQLYRRHYALFQRAYQDLGYPQGYFNDRLVAVIDELLATPAAQGPLELVRPNVMWQFADADLEARSAGQKLLLRIGTAHAAIVRAKLTELRTLIASPSASGSAAAPAVAAPAAASAH